MEDDVATIHSNPKVPSCSNRDTDCAGIYTWPYHCCCCPLWLNLVHQKNENPVTQTFFLLQYTNEDIFNETGVICPSTEKLFS